MAKLAKPAAKPAAKTSKLAAPAKGSAAAKPGKALAKPAAKAKEPAVTGKPGDVVEFTGYQNREENFEPIFEVGDRLVLMDKKKDADNGTTFFAAVKEEDVEAFKADADSVNGDQIYPSEFKKAEKLPDDPFKMDLVTNDTLDTLLGEHEGDALETAKALQEDIARGQFFLGGALQNLYANRAYLEYGDNGEGKPNDYADDLEDDGTVKKMSGWHKFCTEHFNESGRKCFDLLTTFRSFAPLLDAEQLEEVATNKKIGYVKLAAAKNVVNADNVSDILEAAATSNLADFKETLKTDYVAEPGEARSGGGAGAGSKVKRTTIKAVFYEDQAAGVEYVLTTAAKEFGVAPDAYGQILERIVLDWAAQNLGEPAIKKARAEKKKVLKNLKAGGVDTKARLEEDAALEEFLTRNEEEEEGTVSA